MKQRSILFIVLAFFTLLTSCKKESKSVPTPINSPFGATSQGIDAEVTVLKQVTLDGFGGSMYSAHAAVFYASTITNSAVPSVKAGIVSVNGITLKNDSNNIAGPAYADTTFAISGNSYQLTVGGSNQFPAGTLQYGQNFPTFNDTALLPSSIQRSSGISLQFNNCINTDSIVFIIEDLNGHLISKKYAVSNNQVNLLVTPSELSAFSQTANGGITIEMVKSNATLVGTKNYLISLERRYFKLYVQFN